jgi:DNA-directed RNA polymerase sigma subunit (sigma70/sigma32)
MQFQTQLKIVLKRFCFKMKIFKELLVDMKADLRQIEQLCADLERSQKLAESGDKRQQETIERIRKALKTFELKYEVDPDRLVRIVHSFKEHMKDAYKSKREMVEVNLCLVISIAKKTCESRLVLP